jgi:hypothetical protein
LEVRNRATKFARDLLARFVEDTSEKGYRINQVAAIALSHFVAAK